MTHIARRPRVGSRVAFWTIAGVALVVAHDAVFLVQSGPGGELVRALRTSGHAYWGVASAAIALVGLVSGLTIVLRIRALRRRARALGVVARPVPAGSLATLGRLFGLLVIGFLLQENAEHFIAHGHVIGVGALVGPEYPLALPVIAAIAACGAVCTGLLGGTEAALRAAIADALGQLRPRAERGRAPRANIARAVRPSAITHPGAGRAPPVLVAPV